MDWAGYYAVSSYDANSEREYHAIRQSAALIDVTPLFKYDVTGTQASEALTRLMCRDISKIKRGTVLYTSWTDNAGKMLDDGTVARIGPAHYRVTSSEPWLRWFQQGTQDLDVAFEDTTDRIAALSLQGPNSRSILQGCVDYDLDRMRFFKIRQMTLSGCSVRVSRTGYTGDLGFEIWMDAADALTVWDTLMDVGRSWAIEPCGLDAMDISRIEAGFVLQGVDYITARSCFLERQKSSPYEAGLGWTVNLDREPFIGRDALRIEEAAGPQWCMVGLEYNWDDIEAVYDRFHLPPALCNHAWRDGLPIYDEEETRQVGYATSGSWSPVLKKNLALATLPANLSQVGTVLKIEHTVEYQRFKVRVRVTERPFFDPERKRFTPGAGVKHG